MDCSTLIQKYDIPAPRYTSYPTVPYWENSPTTDEWLSYVSQRIEPIDSTIAMYVHIPFCETLCSFCGCNNSITINHSVEEPYIEYLLMELDAYIDSISHLNKRNLNELHLGGGTPTYLSVKNLDNLLNSILKRLKVVSNPDFSCEVDPRRTTKEQIDLLYSYGFRRLSLGVQDFNLEVQQLLNRIQPYEMVKEISDYARKIGFTSINFDLIYGLPRQNSLNIKKTLQKTLDLKPDRIAFYSYAHVPWIKPAQRLFTEKDLPMGIEKRKLYEISKEAFINFGYKELGMDHFSLESDHLWKCYQKGDLKRNFMGYTTIHSDILLGIGVSAISDSGDCFYQNEKVLKKYQKKISNEKFANLRGHKLSKEDIIMRKIIHDLTTKLVVDLSFIGDISLFKEKLIPMEEDKLICWDYKTLYVCEIGKPFLRNICMVFDLRLQKKVPEFKVFSQSI